MNIIVTGSTGHISKPLTSLLAAAGHNVIVITRDGSKKEEIEKLGASAVIGSVEDPGFLHSAFNGADAVYTMVPPNFGATDYRKYISDVTAHYADAIKAAGIKKVINLSSIGAHLDGGTGPISGLHDGEKILNGLQGVVVKHLRAGFFYVNLYANIGMIRNAGIIGANYGDDARLILVHPQDIAAAAAAAFATPFETTSVSYISSDVRTTAEVAKVLGSAIGQPELPWINFSDEQSYDGMKGAALPHEIARMYTEMGAAVRDGRLFGDYDATGSGPTGKTKLEDFAKEFAAVYAA